jgi:predicted ATPase
MTAERTTAVPGDPARARAHVDRVLASDAFARAPSLRRLLGFVVAEALAGRGEDLKEYAIGVEVFGRGDGFDPRADTIVRVQARRLRAKLEEYYAAEGHPDGLAVRLPIGGYWPRFEEVTLPAGPATAALGDWQDLKRESPAAPCAAPLPVPRTPLIGRDAERAAVLAALRDGAARVVTLTGPGGSGKTHLALHAAAAAASDFPGGVFFVGLGALVDAADVGPTVARALGLSRVDGGSVDDALAAHVRRTIHAPTLLVVDTFEQLLPAAPLLAALAGATPALTLLVTSRAVLRVSGECCITVPPLPVPDAACLPPLEALAAAPAIALFVRQAAARRPGFALGAGNAATIATICARLDGLPLAIELAAARSRVLSPAQFLARLEHRLALLTAGDCDRPARQQTLRHAIDWSHDLLTPGERRLFRRLAVFAGPCTLEGAEAVCNPRQEPDLPVLDGLSSLVDKSLLHHVDDDGGEPRFAMLDTVREYAMEQLDASGEGPVTRRAHAAWCIVLAEEGRGPLTAGARDAWLARCQREHENHRAALDHLIATADAEWALRLAIALSDYWDRRGHRLEGCARFEALLRLPALAGRTRARAAAVAYGSLLAPVREATGAAREALGIYRELGDLRGVIGQLNNLGVNHRLAGDDDGARAWLEEGVRICRELGDRAALGSALSNLADVRRRQGAYAEAASALEEAHDLFRSVGHALGEAWSLNHLGDVARAAGDRAAAQACYRRGADVFRRIGDHLGVARSAIDLGHLAAEAGDAAGACALFVDALDAFAAADHRLGIAIALEGCACAAAGAGDRVRALRLAGAAAAVRRGAGAGPCAGRDAGTRLDRRVAELWSIADPAAAEARDAGGAMALGEAIVLARGGAGAGY